MSSDILYGSVVRTQGFYDGKNTSEKITKTKSEPVTSLVAAQARMIEESTRLARQGMSDIGFKLITDKTHEVKRIEVTWTESKQFIPVKKGVAKKR